MKSHQTLAVLENPKKPRKARKAKKSSTKNKSKKKAVKPADLGLKSDQELALIVRTLKDKKKRSKGKRASKKKKPTKTNSRPKSRPKKRSPSKMNFQSCKKLFLDSALTSNQENLEIVNTELQRLNSDLAQRFDVVPSDTELLASRVADMSDNRYNKDAHIKYQFLTAMKTAMELGDLIQVTAKEPVDKTAIKEPVLVGDPNMSQTNVETNEIILDNSAIQFHHLIWMVVGATFVASAIMYAK